MKDGFSTITSRENSKFKLWSKLLTKKYRDREGLFLLEGGLLIEDALKTGWKIEELIISSSVEDASRLIPGVTAIEIPEKYILAEELFRKLSQTENGRDVIGVLRKPEYKLEALKVDRGAGLSVLVSCGVSDPGNLGTIIRSADGAGYSGVLILKGSADPFSPKVVRGAAGSILRVPIIEIRDVEELKNAVKSLGLTAVGASEKGERTIWEEDLSHGIALFMGNEGNGIPKDAMDILDKQVKIPMEGSMDSLNVGVAASLIMFESLRQNKGKQ